MNHGRPLRGRIRLRALLSVTLVCGLLFAGPSGAREMTMNMKDADIEALISTVAEVTGRNFVIDPRVEGKVTVISSTPMDEEQVFQVFLSILKVHGFAAVETGGIIKIVPDTSAKADNVGTVTAGSPGTGDEFITRVISMAFPTKASAWSSINDAFAFSAIRPAAANSRTRFFTTIPLPVNIGGTAITIRILSLLSDSIFIAR